MLNTRHWTIVALVAALVATVAVGLARSQTSPNFIPGQVPTAAQWNSYFASKQDVLNFVPVSRQGGTMLGLLKFSMGAPSLSVCGTNPSVTGNNQAGIVTMGTGNPTTCTITFNGTNPYAAVPMCVVSWQVNLASMQYVVTAGSISLTQTATSSNKVNYFCAGLQ